MSGARLGFSCRSCDCHWARTYAGEGDFRWEAKTRAPSKTHEIGWAVPSGRR